MKFCFLAISILFFGASAFSADMESCTPLIESRGNISIRRIFYADDGACNLAVSHLNPKTTYRDYSFGNYGGMLIFVNYSNYESEGFGTREFYFLPNINQFPQFNWNDEKRVLEVIMTNGQKACFSYEDAELLSIDGAKVKVSSDLSPKMEGGVEIKILSGLLMDTGFRLDKLNSQSPDKLSQFTDSNFGSCKLANRELFKYKASGDVVFGLSSEKLMVLLKKKCPNITTPDVKL